MSILINLRTHMEAELKAACSLPIGASRVGLLILMSGGVVGQANQKFVGATLPVV